MSDVVVFLDEESFRVLSFVVKGMEISGYSPGRERFRRQNKV